VPLTRVGHSRHILVGGTCAVILKILGVSLVWRSIAIGILATVVSVAPSARAQNSSYPPHKSSPPQIDSHIVVLTDSVVREQWTHTLELVNAPQNVSLLNPGECVRVGVIARGDNRDDYLRHTALSFHIRLAGHTDSYPLVPLSEFKRIKPQGGDFVNEALGSAGIKEPAEMDSMASLGASGARWCVPEDAADGTATIEAEVDSPVGHQALSPGSIHIESFQTGSKKAFKDVAELGAFLQTYYRHPNPGRLLPALQFILAEQTQQRRQGQAEIFAAFLVAALKSNPVAAKDFLMCLRTQAPLTRAFGLLAVRSAGYDISGVLDVLSAQEQEKFRSLPPLPSPYDLTPSQQLFEHLDMLWAVFGATGKFKPVQTISTALGWRTDYEDFEKLRKTPNHSSALTPSIVRAVVYSAAGWSLSSFQRNDPLVADYIQFLRASPDTPKTVKSELAALSSNPAFKRPGGP
jgi:hypothetical protein